MEKLPIVFLACKVFEGWLESHLPPEISSQLTFLDYGLHSVPKKLRQALQDRIDQIEEPSLVVLGYGSCGGGLNGVQAGKHVLLVPRTDDCIAIMLGSYKSYREQFDHTPGTYYLSKGWLESGSNPLQEYHTYVERYGEEQASWLMDLQYKNYKRLALVAHKHSDLEHYRPQAEEVARYCERWGMRYEEILGSDEYLRRLVETAIALDGGGDDFIVVPPGGELSLANFLRM